MDLYGGRLPWTGTLEDIPDYPGLEGSDSCDVLIVGGGMGGAMMAHRLAADGADAVLIDKRRVAGGSSSANTGLLQVANDKTLTSCIHTFGQKQGVLFYTLCKESIEWILRLPDELDIDPQIVSRSSLYYASMERDVARLREECETLTANGFPCEWWDEGQIASAFSFSKPAAVYMQGDAEANPYRTVHGLIRYAVKRGVRVYEHTEGLHFDYLPDGVVCHTSHGRIHARCVVFALGYETQEMKKDRGAELLNTYAIMTKPLKQLPKWHERCLIWETARPYGYYRLTPDNRIVAGGMDEALTDPHTRAVRALSQGRRLMEELYSLFPELEEQEPEFSWGAVFGTTRDGLPFIGPHPDYPHSYFIEGYGGNGTVYSMIAARLLAQELAGKRPPELDLFSFTRSAKPVPKT